MTLTQKKPNDVIKAKRKSVSSNVLKNNSPRRYITFEIAQTYCGTTFYQFVTKGLHVPAASYSKMLVNKSNQERKLRLFILPAVGAWMVEAWMQTKLLRSYDSGNCGLQKYSQLFAARETDLAAAFKTFAEADAYCCRIIRGII